MSRFRFLRPLWPLFLTFCLYLLYGLTQNFCANLKTTSASVCDSDEITDIADMHRRTLDTVLFSAFVIGQRLFQLTSCPR